ncbi:PAS domain-containing hybrid sensor histidine kinase/response regulator [Butyrivibrio sp. FC2001]|uniref:PAS domain-containing hybrid sensor histidine kinase/response regulator n=1 Tax=Butyrivibrio sp. FC2001 TaxID=1280671 RepID=UPI000686CEEC|nr:PAS domain-containing hybrid sensor histidine kinase/response regulator [Butyrivibrio sp. FC2001]
MSNTIYNGNLSDKMPDEQIFTAIEWLAEQMPGGFFIYRADEGQEILYVNQATLLIFGCETIEEFKEHTGYTFRGMVHPEDYEEIQESIDEQIADEDNKHNLDYVIYRIIRKDGEERWVDDYGRFTYLPGFGDVYYVFISDITETRIAQEQRERNEQLERLLAEAEQANMAKTAFLSNMSHEIRTPITAILGMNEMIQRESSDPAILEYSENIRKAGTSLLRIISDILDFSKIETGRMELVLEPYSTKALYADLYNLVQLRAESKGIGLKFEVDPQIPEKLLGDEIRIKQIISNILTNSIKYTERGYVKLIAYLESIQDGIANIEITVLDTGIGIREEEMARLFEAFDRLDVKRTRTIEGTGLGLAITKHLLSLMGSKLEVESEYERGSSFSFYLKQKVIDETPVGEVDFTQIEKDKRNPLKKHSYFVAKDLKILVVDDTPMNLQVIKGLLKRTCMKIDTASGGAECLMKIGQGSYDMVFLDYRMPNMNGVETLDEIKRRFPDFYEKVPIISLTASAISGDKEKLLAAGFTDYLAKPVNIDEMEKMMMKYLPGDAISIVDPTAKGNDEAKGNDVAEENPAEEEDDELQELPKVLREYKGIDAGKGIEYCGDADDYMYVIQTYAKSVNDKAAQIEKNLAEKDMDNYIINVHSLKSTSLAIGATQLSEKAKALEAAAKEGKTDNIEEDTKQLLSDYRELKTVLDAALKE